MHSQKEEFGLPELRRQLEELLNMVKADTNGLAFNQRIQNASDTGRNFSFSGDHYQRDTACEPPSRETTHHEVTHPEERDALYDDAVVVVTEFGQASPAILQMWPSIDYSRAFTIMSRFQADGLISSKGKVRHKAFALRRSLEPQT